VETGRGGTVAHIFETVLVAARNWQIDSIRVFGVVLPVDWSLGTAAVEILLNIVDESDGRCQWHCT